MRKTIAIPVGTLVRFTIDALGASVRDELWCTTGETYGVGEGGAVAFAHPNPKLSGEWVYVEVPSKSHPGELRYVGVTAAMVEWSKQSPAAVKHRSRRVKGAA